MAIFRLYTCHCRYQRHTSGLCPKCNKELKPSHDWYISFTHQGRLYTYAISPSIQKARDALAKVRVEIREGKFFKRTSTIKWDRACEIFRQHYKTHTKAGTQGMYNNSLNQLSQHFSDCSLHEITLPMVEEYKRIRSKAVSLASVDRDLASLKRLFSFIEEQGHIDKNPIRKAKLFRPHNERERMLTETEIKRLLDACTIPYLRLAVLIALNTGLRKGTIMGLRWDNVDLNRKVIRVRTKGDKMVSIPLTALYSSLIKWKRDNPGSPFLFRSTRGKGPMNRDSIKRSFATACDMAKLSDFRFHDLRHTFASYYIIRTGDLRTCQELLGHSTATMTRRYSHLLDSHVRQAMRRFGGIGISKQAVARKGDQIRGSGYG